MSPSFFYTSSPKNKTKNSSEAEKTKPYSSLKNSPELHKTEQAKGHNREGSKSRKSNSRFNSSSDNFLQKLSKTKSFTPEMLEEVKRRYDSSDIFNTY